jgi:hypothetical protein
MELNPVDGKKSKKGLTYLRNTCSKNLRADNINMNPPLNGREGNQYLPYAFLSASSIRDGVNGIRYNLAPVASNIALPITAPTAIIAGSPPP